MRGRVDERRLHRREAIPPEKHRNTVRILSKVAAAAAAVALPLLSGCGLVQREQMRLDVASMDTIGAERLGLVKGETTFGQAEKAMRQKRMTGIVSESFAKAGAPTLDVLAADYQEELHMFEDSLFKGTIKLRTEGVPPYGFGLRLAESKGQMFLLALYRDPLDNVGSGAGIAPEPPRIEVFMRKGASWVHEGRMRLRNIVRRHGGLTDPLFVGHDLDSGITLLGRAKSGTIWERGYFLAMRPVDGRERLTIIGSETLSKLAACSCVQNYIYGKQDGRLPRLE
ncbi:TPA: hypothetical protein EYP38_01130 [Candidatus Micrarchaeota archaeon]|nr:hypothetical protein [Candidatus Micrarchaeota archaeon]